MLGKEHHRIRTSLQGHQQTIFLAVPALRTPPEMNPKARSIGKHWNNTLNIHNGNFNSYLIIMTPPFHIWAPASLDTLREPSQTLANAEQVKKLTIKYSFLRALWFKPVWTQS